MLYTSYMNKKYLIELIKSVILSKQPPEKPDEVSFEEIFKISKIHNIANLVYYAVAKLENKPDGKLLKLWKREKSLGMILDVTQSTEFSKLKFEFEKNSIKYIPLKGFELKNLYPKSDMRKMGDIDILILEKDRENVKNIMLQYGYTLKSYGTNREDSYIKKPSMNIEIHNNLFDETDTLFYNYFENLSKMEKVNKINEFHYEFSLEDNFLYNFIHMFRHFSCRGTGIRSVVDHWLYITKKEKDLNWEYIYKSLKELGLLEFYEKFTALSKVWFEEKESNEILENLEEYIFKSGLYGNMENYGLTKLSKEKVGIIGKVKTVFKLFFPSVKVMIEKYPKLRNYPFLLPIYYIIRSIQVPQIHGKKTMKTVLRSILFSNRDKIKTREDFFCSIGLYDLYKKK